MRNKDGHSIILGTTEIEKDIEVQFANKVSFKDHIIAAAKKGNHIVGLICRSFTFCDLNTFPFLFRSLGLLHLEYANAIMGPQI